MGRRRRETQTPAAITTGDFGPRGKTDDARGNLEGREAGAEVITLVAKFISVQWVNISFCFVGI